MSHIGFRLVVSEGEWQRVAGGSAHAAR